MTVLVTGAAGFIGKNLVALLRRRPELTIRTFDVQDTEGQLGQYLAESNVVYHLAGVNRPDRIEEYEAVNAGLTAKIAQHLERAGRHAVLVFSSSIQAEQENPYGRSKALGESAIREYAQRAGAPAVIFRLPNVFGKWCLPDYNSVVATFCHNIANGLPIRISEPEKALTLVYVDDVVRSFARLLDNPCAGSGGCTFEEVRPAYKVTVGALANLIIQFNENRARGVLEDYADRFYRCLYATYLTYLPPARRVYRLNCKIDGRGTLAEFLESPHFGQLFVSRTKPGQTRGNHVHDTKAEKFCVLEGEAVIRLAGMAGNKTIHYRVTGRDFAVVDIPPGYAHSIENVGPGELVVLFWANEPFDPQAADTYPCKVLQ